MVKKGEVSVCLYRRKRRRSPFAFIVEKGEVLRCLLRQEKERCPFAFIVEKGEVSVCLYRRKRSCRVALPFTPRKGVVVSRCLLRQEKESSCRVAFYAKKRSRRVVSWIFFPKRRILKKLLKTPEAGMRKLSLSQLNPLSCRVRMSFPKRRMSKSFL